MKTTERFDNAVTKLYNAFNNGELNAFSCYRCAVGNILDNDTSWMSLGDNIGERVFTFEQESRSGYSAKELNVVELKFMRGVSSPNEERKFTHYVDNPSKKTQFKGLCAVVEYLCELDNIPNVMDYTKLFETENDKPKYQLA